MATDPSLPGKIQAAYEKACELANTVNHLAPTLEPNHIPPIWVGLSRQRHEQALAAAHDCVNNAGGYLWNLADDFLVFKATIVARIAAEQASAREAAEAQQWVQDHTPSEFTWPPPGSG